MKFRQGTDQKSICYTVSVKVIQFILGGEGDTQQGFPAELVVVVGRIQQEDTVQ